MGGALVIGLRTIKNVFVMFFSFFSLLACVHLMVAEAGKSTSGLKIFCIKLFMKLISSLLKNKRLRKKSNNNDLN
jgi:hypothetical protein